MQIFSDTSASLYKKGMIYLGVDDLGREIGIKTDRHLTAFGGPRSGKGAGLIIPNAKRWPHNLLMIDPKGENLENTWQDREGLGQTVAALDPFMVAKVPDRLRVSCNLLAGIDPNGLTAREDIRVIADGMVIRFKAEDGTWDNGSVAVIAGLIDYVLATHPPQERDLTAIRRLLTLPPEALKEAFSDMAETKTATGLARAAAAIGLSESKKNREFVSGAAEHTEWLDSPAMASVLTGSGGFDMSLLKKGAASLYLVLPPKYLAEHGRFLRLFVRAALDSMSCELDGQKCLFILDEFFSLGHIDQISKAAGLMPGYGVHLWPILQNLGQLTSLYGVQGAQNFFAGSDAHIFFGLSDPETLLHVAQRIGTMRTDDFKPRSPLEGIRWLDDTAAMPTDTEAQRQSRREAYEARASILRGMETIHNSEVSRSIGQLRIPPEKVRELIAKKDDDKVAVSMIVFGKGDDIFNLRLAPYFMPLPSPVLSSKSIEKERPAYVQKETSVSLADMKDRVEGEAVGRCLMLAALWAVIVGGISASPFVAVVHFGVVFGVAYARQLAAARRVYIRELNEKAGGQTFG